MEGDGKVNLEKKLSFYFVARIVVIVVPVATLAVLAGSLASEQERADTCYQQSQQYKQALVADNDSIVKYLNDPSIAPDVSEVKYHIAVAQSLDCKK